MPAVCGADRHHSLSSGFATFRSTTQRPHLNQLAWSHYRSIHDWLWFRQANSITGIRKSSIGWTPEQQFSQQFNRRQAVPFAGSVRFWHWHKWDSQKNGVARSYSISRVLLRFAYKEKQIQNSGRNSLDFVRQSRSQLPYCWRRTPSAAMYSGVPKTCLSENCTGHWRRTVGEAEDVTFGDRSDYAKANLLIMANLWRVS